MPGRKMKLVENNKKHLTNEEKKVRETAQRKASDGLTMLQATPPRHLKGAANWEYQRIIKDLQTLPVRNLDRAVLEVYCTWYGVYKEVLQKLDEVGYTIFDEEKGWISNPLILTLEKATAQIRTSAAQLGLTVDSRMKIFVPKTEEKPKSIFDKFGG